MFLRVELWTIGVNDFLTRGERSREKSMIVVAAALIRADGSILVQQRHDRGPHGGLWEFPGGKCEAGESLAGALARELEEELGVVVACDALHPLTFASEPLGSEELLLLLFACRSWQGEARALDAQQIRWCSPADLLELPMPPADIPLARELVRRAAG
jgi:8-oxo-dGTP diphosphatase